MASNPGISRSSPMISGIRSDVPPSNGDAVLRAREADDGPVAVLRRPVLDRRERRVLVAQLVDDLVDLRRRRSSSISGAKLKFA